jgi:hypothetical protein
LRAHFGLHAARQGARQPASLVQAARAVISRRRSGGVPSRPRQDQGPAQVVAFTPVMRMTR